jgi:hypothetical protein
VDVDDPLALPSLLLQGGHASPGMFVRMEERAGRPQRVYYVRRGSGNDGWSGYSFAYFDERELPSRWGPAAVAGVLALLPLLFLLIGVCTHRALTARPSRTLTTVRRSIENDRAAPGRT